MLSRIRSTAIIRTCILIKLESDFELIAENGDHVMECEMDYEVTKLIPSAGEETVKVYFVGADDREYVVEMDFDGNWLTDPELAS